mmetsp:Transcript_127858/g.239075  ORF Transcript_127858/g.239075 Transcript_127858/m.239075 type:complete len:354 (-) Transcript_127858:30-1091(-)
MPEHPTVQVQVQSVGGEVLELDVKARSLVRGLKQKIEQRWRVPFESQKLVCETTILKDSDSIASHLQGASPVLCVTLVKALDTLYSIVGDGKERPEKRILNMRKLADLVPKGDEDAIHAFFLCLADPTSEVRRASVEMLLQVGGRNNERVISELCDCSEGTSVDTKLAAITGLRQVAERGNDRVVTTLIKLSRDEKPTVRRTALYALPQAADLDDDRIIAAVIEEMKKVDAAVPYSAEQVLPQAVNRGNQFVISEMIELLRNMEQVHYLVRTRAVHVICKVALPDDMRAVDAILEAGVDPDERIRLAVIEDLPGLVRKGDRRAIALLKEIASQNKVGVLERAAGKSLSLLQSV